MNNPALNRMLVARGTAIPTKIGFQHTVDYAHWPCKKDHDPSRVKRYRGNTWVCMECDWEKKQLERYGDA